MPLFSDGIFEATELLNHLLSVAANSWSALYVLDNTIHAHQFDKFGESECMFTGFLYSMIHERKEEGGWGWVLIVSGSSNSETSFFMVKCRRHSWWMSRIFWMHSTLILRSPRSKNATTLQHFFFSCVKGALNFLLLHCCCDLFFSTLRHNICCVVSFWNKECKMQNANAIKMQKTIEMIFDLKFYKVIVELFWWKAYMFVIVRSAFHSCPFPDCFFSSSGFYVRSELMLDPLISRCLFMRVPCNNVGQANSKSGFNPLMWQANPGFPSHHSRFSSPDYPYLDCQQLYPEIGHFPA